MTDRTRHLRDDGLVNCYFSARHGEALDPPSIEHLTDCEACRARYAEITGLLERVRQHGEVEADAVFTPERLRAQHQQIGQRVAHVGRVARVISFPRQLVDRTITTSTSHTALRWIAAAAAGLFVGVALGASYEWQWRTRSARPMTGAQTAVASTTVMTPMATRGSDPAPDVAADDAFLSELELALDRPRPSELQPFDALTPHVREIRDVR